MGWGLAMTWFILSTLVRQTKEATPLCGWGGQQKGIRSWSCRFISIRFFNSEWQKEWWILFSNQDLRRQLHDAETQAWENGQAKDRELQVSSGPGITAHCTAFTDPCRCALFVCVCVQDLGRRLREAESLAQQAQPKLAARDREIQVVCRGWRWCLSPHYYILCVFYWWYCAVSVLVLLVSSICSNCQERCKKKMKR